MNVRKLEEAEAAFLGRFPGGFADPGMERVCTSHDIDRLASCVRENLTPITLSQPHRLVDTLLKIARLLEIDDLAYRPRPDWAFYGRYRKLLLDIRKLSIRA